LYGPVLKRIVEQNLFDAGLKVEQFPDGIGPPFAHADPDLMLKFSIKLQRFITNRFGGIVIRGDSKSFCFSAIAPA
jgi:hypothetical protein